MVQEGELALTQEEIPDSLIVSEPQYGLVLTPPPVAEQSSMRGNESTGVSFILSGMFILFLVTALRFRNNIKYAVAMFRNLIETRTRQNVFDDTVRETSLIVMLNIIWCVSAGVIAYNVFAITHHSTDNLFLPSIGMLWGMAIAVIYSLFMWGAYTSVGWIFSDRAHSELWVKGFSASQALMTPALFLTALITICRPETALTAGIVSATVFVMVKLVFIWKGYRIFFNQFSSWVLFLCYLCSLEIVPLILSYRCAYLLIALRECY